MKSKTNGSSDLMPTATNPQDVFKQAEQLKKEQAKDGPKNGCFTDVQQLRKQARENLKDGAITEGYKANKDKVIELLNEALATELVCVLRYRKHYFMAKGLDSEPIAEEFLVHSNEELGHADKLAARITQLGGEPDMNPDILLKRSHAEFRDVKSLEEMIAENLVAERIAIDSYKEMIAYVQTSDPTTRKLLEEILEVEEDHANELADLIT